MTTFIDHLMALLTANKLPALIKVIESFHGRSTLYLRWGLHMICPFFHYQPNICGLFNFDGISVPILRYPFKTQHFKNHICVALISKYVFSLESSDLI